MSEKSVFAMLDDPSEKKIDRWIGMIHFLGRVYRKRWWQRKPDIFLSVYREGCLVFESIDRREIEAFLYSFLGCVIERQQYLERKDMKEQKRSALDNPYDCV